MNGGVLVLYGLLRAAETRFSKCKSIASGH